MVAFMMLKLPREQGVDSWRPRMGNSNEGWWRLIDTKWVKLEELEEGIWEISAYQAAIKKYRRVCHIIKVDSEASNPI